MGDHTSMNIYTAQIGFEGILFLKEHKVRYKESVDLGRVVRGGRYDQTTLHKTL